MTSLDPDGHRPPRPIAADWLALRRPADENARAGTARLLTRLWRHLHARPDACAGEPVHMIDVGAGTGANQAWLAPRLPFAATWTLLDHDPALLHHPLQGTGQRIVADLSHLPDLLAQDDAWARVVTCSALLDLLTHDDLDTLAELLVDTGTPALLSLTVTGEVDYAPADEADHPLALAFDEHQSRDGLAGPAAAPHLAARLASLGAQVVRAHTPWRLAAGDAELLQRFLQDRVDAALEAAPGLDGTASSWLERRLDQAGAGTLAVVVGHEDLLVLPDHVPPVPR